MEIYPSGLRGFSLVVLTLAGIFAGGQLAQAQSLPVINVLYPNGTNQFQASPTLTFTASSAAAIAPSAITVQLTGTSLPGTVYSTTLSTANGLTVSGTASNPSVSAPLASNLVYSAVIQVTDANENTATATVSFDTITPGYTFEAEDFDFGGGQYINPPQTNAYYGLAATTAVDAYNPSFSGANSYNRANGLNTEPDGDIPRAAYDGTGATDYDVGWATAGNWANYTRNFPAGTYNLYVRIANPNATGVNPDEASVSLVTSGRGTSSQTTRLLGTFSAPATGSWQVYAWAPVLDNHGNLVQFVGGAEETLRVTTDNSGYNANFYLLMPANTNAAVLTNLYPDGSAFFQYTNQLSFVAASSAGIGTNAVVVVLDGVDVSSELSFNGSLTSWQVTCPVALNASHTAVITVTASNGAKAISTVNFNDFAPTNYQFEAEDYDYGGGHYLDNPQTNAYYGLSSLAGVDNVQADVNATPFLYRPPPAPASPVAGDGLRPQFSRSTDYSIGSFGGGSWANYTRHYPAGTYYVEGRFAEGGSQTEAVLSQLASGYGTSVQTSNVLGTFFIPPSGGTTNWEWSPLTDASGIPVKVGFDGSQTTLQLAGSPVVGQPEVNVNFFMLVPTVPDPILVVQAINYGTTNVAILYSKPVATASATNLANYVFTNGLVITGAVLNPDNRTVVLTTGPLVYGSNYSLVINGVRDRMNLPSTIATNTTVNFQALPYITQSVGNPAVLPVAAVISNGLSITSVGSNAGGTNDQGTFSYQPYTGNFDLCMRVANLGLSDVFAQAGLMAREQLTTPGRFAAALTTPAMNGSFFTWRDPAGSTANTAGNFPANYPNTWLRLNRVGNTFTGYASYDGQTWTELGSDTIAMANQVDVGFWVSSHSRNAVTTAQFLNFNAVTNGVIGPQVNPHDAMGPTSRRTPLVFSEIMWKPAARTDGKNLEYLELYNSNPWFQDISSYQITCADMNYTFPAGTLIPGGGYLVVAAAPADVTSVYGITNVMGPYAGSLKHAETLELLDERTNVLLTLPYTDAYPWPVATGGTGHSLVLANPTYGEGDPRAWDLSDVVGGSPGQMDGFTPSPLRSVVINEILPHSENPAVAQFIELYNHSTNSVNLAGCILTDDPATNKFVIPSGTVIGPAGFVSFTQAQFGFTLNGAGETLYLIKPDGSRILDAVQFGAQANGVSYGRWPDGANDFYAFTTNTPGTNNSPICIGDVVINELMYDPFSGNNDDQYIELYNQGTNTLNLDQWQFTSGVTFTFPQVTLPPNGYLVVAKNLTNLLAKYTNLNRGNTVGNYSGKLSHSGALVRLAQPETLNGTNTILVAEDEVTYGTGGRWGEWAGGGGSSLELIDPHSNHRLAANWADSIETAKTIWTNVTWTGVLDNGQNYDSSIDYAQIGILDAGECLVDNIQVIYNGTNYVSNSTFDGSPGLANWSLQGDMVRSSLESPGYQSSTCLHIRCSDKFWTGDNSCEVALRPNALAAGQTVTLSYEARWVHGLAEPDMRLNGNWLEATTVLPVPNNLGSPGLPNSTYITNAGPALYQVTHNPPVPAANQPVVVTAQVSDPDGLQSLTLYYRLDPSKTYTAVPMTDAGTGGDAIAKDGIYSAMIPGKAANQVVAFYLAATDKLGAVARFPAVRPGDNEPVRECVVMFGDGNPGGSFGVYHLWLTQTNIARWANLGDLSNEGIDGTFVNGKRVIYNMQGHYAGSPYHQEFDSPVGNLCHYNWSFNDDDMLLGTKSFNKIHQPGNGPGDDPSLQREELAHTFLRALGVPWLSKRYVAVYVNGNRRGVLMEDTQVPDSDVVKEHWPNDSGGFLYKMQPWFEFAPFLSGYSMSDNNNAWCSLVPYTTTDGAKKAARYRYNFEIRRTADTWSDFTNAFSLVDAASDSGSPNYVANLENLADMENWMRVFAANHAAGNWDSFGSANGQNLYGYMGTQGTKYSLLMWDYNIVIGNSSSWGPGQNLFAINGADTGLAAIYNNPTFLRMYWRALQDLVNGPLNPAISGPLLVAKYNAFINNGLSVENPTAAMAQAGGYPGIEAWIAQARSSIAAQLAAVNAGGFAVNSTVTTSKNLASVTGTAPVSVSTVWVNGAAYPLTWTTLSTWVVTIPLAIGTNHLNVVGVDQNGQPLTGTSNSVSVVYNGANASPVGQVVINEITYAPVNNHAQFLELYNNSTNLAFDLSGWQVAAIDYTFPAGSVIAPTNYLVLAANGAAFAAAYGATNPVFDTFSGTLPASGLLALTTSSNVTVAEVAYENQLPWPTNTDGTGASLQLIDPHQDNWRAGNWSSTPFTATPGAPNSVAAALIPFPSLWINEVQADNLTGLTNRAGQHAGWVEIYNPSTNRLSLSGLGLANNYTNLLQWPFPTNAAINPGQFKVIFADAQTNLSTTNELHTSFTLSSGSGAVVLTRLPTSGQPQVLDYVAYQNLGANDSYGSFPDGQSFSRQEFFQATPGAPNNGTAVPPPSFVDYTTPAAVYAQNFDSLPDPGATSVNSANTVTINGITYSLANPYDFAYPAVASGSTGGLNLPALTGWYGTSDLEARLGATDGDQTTGGQISFGLPSSSNRALGLLATSSTGGTAFGVRLLNDTGMTLNRMNLQFTGEVWRQSNLPKTLQFYYVVDSTGTAAFPTNATAFLPALNVGFPTVAADVGGAAVDGTAAPNQANLSVVDQAITNWSPGAALWLVWQMTDSTGKAQGLAIDNLSFSASVPLPVPLTVQPNGTNLLLNWPGVPGQTYQLEYKNNLTDPAWTPVGNPVTGTGGALALTNNSGASPQRFFHLRLVN